MKSEADLSLLARQWGATAVPFGLVNPHDWLETPNAQKALACLSQTAALRSVMLLCGPNGIGKSVLAGRWMRSLDSRLLSALCLTQATLSGTGVLMALATKLGKPASYRRERNLQFIQEALDELERRILVVILDEAQNYNHTTLEEVRLLLGLNLPEQPAFALVLIGDEYLLASLKLRNQRALYSRLACQFTLEPWNSAQCAQYLATGLSAVGLSSSVLESAATELLASASAGLPRSLCLLARAAWINAATTSKAQKITPDHVNTALQQVPCVPGLISSSSESSEP
jgi:type II secretory pathway predicted ATPase ExeA